ncbi:DUF4254 domain-containing protein [Nocardia brasiliensis]
MSTSSTPAPTVAQTSILAITFNFRRYRISIGNALHFDQDSRRSWPASGVHRSRTRRVRFRRGRFTLPSAAEVIAVCDPAVARSEDPVLDAIRMVARLAADDHAHATGHDDDPEELELTHEALLERIDRLIDERMSPPDREADVHTETLAPVIDRLVTLTLTRAQISAQLPYPDAVVAELDTALADLRRAYDQLITELITGQRRLPRHQHTPAT